MQVSRMPRYVNRDSYASHPAWGIIMSGGLRSGRNVAVTKNAKDFDALALKPIATDWHCVAAIDEDRIFVTGGFTRNSWSGVTARNESFMYSKTNGEWVSLPNMPTARWVMGCGVVRDDDGKVEVVVVGGYNGTENSNGIRTDKVEIYNVNEESWRTGM